MWSKNYDGWNQLKQQLELSELTGHFRAREVWFCSIGINVGREQDGQNVLFERPVLILKTFTPELFWGVSLSTKIKPTNPYYLSFRHGGEEFSAIISQLRLYDTKRLIRKLYTLEPTTFKEIQLRLIQELAEIGIKSDPP
jgi:hypothetical protein